MTAPTEPAKKMAVMMLEMRGEVCSSSIRTSPPKEISPLIAKCL